SPVFGYEIFIHEYRGVLPSGLDQTSAVGGNSATPASAPFAIRVAGELVTGQCIWVNAYVSSPGLTVHDNCRGDLSFHALASDAGTFIAQLVQNPAGDYLLNVATFLPVGFVSD